MSTPANTPTTNKNNELKTLWVRLGVVVAIILIVNFLASMIYHRFDLTSEKRYSLSPATIQLLKNNKKPILIQVYLEGELESGFLRMQNATRDLLIEMKTYSNADFSFEFIDPVPASASQELRYKIYQEMAAQGFEPTNLRIKNDDQYEEKIIFPSMKVSVGEQYLPVQILENQIGYSPEEALNHSIISIEYKVANAIKRMTDTKRPNVVFLQGHGEALPRYTYDMAQKLKENRCNVTYNGLTQGFISVENDTIPVWDPSNTDVLVVVRPTSAFTEYEKFKIDQYIMNGGRVLWMIDALDAHNNYLQNADNVYFTKPFELGLDDMLFKYGVRINRNLVQDGLQSAPIPLIDKQDGSPLLYPWLYHPLLTPGYNHPIGRNLDPILSRYANSIDTIQNNIKKTIILSTSKYGRVLPQPVRVHLGAVKEKINYKYFGKPYIPTGVLLEGQFESLYKNRIKPEALNTLGSRGITPVDISKPNKMIVISDADIAINHVSNKGIQYPMGYDPYSQQTFANADFIKNCIEYLVDDNGLLTARNKEIKLRMLDKQRIKQEAINWQLLNLLIPILMVVGFGIVYTYIRKRKWAMPNHINTKTNN